MSAGTELAPARSRAPSRKVRKRDERVRRVVRKIRKTRDLAGPATFRGRPNAITDQLTRMAGRLGQLAAQLGLLPSAERALRHDAALEVSHRKWIALADAKDGEVVPAPAAPAASAPPEAAANGTPRMPGFTSPA
jgi:hypothetical protein